MGIDKKDVEYMLSNGVTPFLKQRFNSFEPSESFTKFHKKLTVILLAIVKTTTVYYILTKIFDKLGLEKFILLIFAGYIAVNYVKINNKEDKVTIENHVQKGE